MAYKRLWILVEGNDDKRFFEGIIKPVLDCKYKFVQTWRYAQEPHKRIKNFLKSIKAMNSSYFFLKDINRAPCVTSKRNSIKRNYGARIDINNIIIVVKEIESWYLAGLDNKSCRELGLRAFRNTDNVTKENFNSLMPEKFDSRIDFMIEILKRFSVETGMQKNTSFNYLMAKI